MENILKHSSQTKLETLENINISIYPSLNQDNNLDCIASHPIKQKINQCDKE